MFDFLLKKCRDWNTKRAVILEITTLGKQFETYLASKAKEKDCGSVPINERNKYRELILYKNGLEEDKPKAGQFDTAPWYKKSLVLVAGVIGNMILAFVLFTASYMVGLPADSASGIPTVVSVSKGSPAEVIGIHNGDVIKSIFIDSKKVDTLDTEHIHQAVVDSKGMVVISYQRGQDFHTVSIIPENKTGNKLIGLAIEPLATVKLGLFNSIGVAWGKTWSTANDIVHMLGILIKGLFSHESILQDFVGPVGLAKQVGVAATFGFGFLLSFAALISVNLAVINILPFPALDGGRLLIVLAEAIVGKTFSKKVINIVHLVGFGLLLLLMLFLTIGDIGKLIK